MRDVAIIGVGLTKCGELWEQSLRDLYVVSRGGGIYRFSSPSSIFTDGFESGDTSVWSATVP